MSPLRVVLVVEDDAPLRRMFRTALALDGFDVREAGDGLDALRLIDAETPDAVVLDLGLPLISGYTVRQEIAAHAQTRYVPVVVVTGLPGTHDELDAACVLLKPVTPDNLVRTVRMCIAAARGPAGA